MAESTWHFIAKTALHKGKIENWNGRHDAIALHLDQDVNDFITKCDIPCSRLDESTIVFHGSNTIDFFGVIDKAQELNITRYMLTKQHRSNAQNIPKCRVAKTHPNAVIPFKVRESDVGYDLSVIDVHKVVNGVTTLYKTGIKLQVDLGWYAEIVPRSSLIKSGYMLANSIGIIDNSYTGELLVALTKVDPDAPEITFPFRGCQLIFRTQQHVSIEEVSDLNATSRGEGGFGSSG